MSVESNLKKLDGIDDSIADLDSQIVSINGNKIDLDKVKETIEGIGYIYDGKVA